MNTFLVTFLMWIPFLLYASIYGTIYSIRGYKKGLYRSLISVVATVVSGIISAILAKFFAVGMADRIYNLVMSENGGSSNETFDRIVELFAKGLIQGIIALFMFSTILFFLTIILKVIASVIVKDRFEPQNPKMRWGGLGVRFIEAMIFSLLLLLPIYGTAATYMPIVEEMIEFSSTSDEIEDVMVASEIVGKIGNHPLVKAAKTKPMEIIYNGLAKTKIENSTLNLPKMISSISGVLEQLKGIENLPEDEQKLAIQSLIKYIDKNLIGQEWFYDVYLLVKDEMVNMYKSSTNDLTDDEKVFADEFIVSLDMSEKEFQSCMKGTLDFAEYLITSDFMNRLEQGEDEVLYTDEFLYSFGKWLNCSESMLSIKKMFVLMSLNSVTKNAEVSMKIISGLNLKIHTDKEEQKTEAAGILDIIKKAEKVFSQSSVDRDVLEIGELAA